MSIQDAAVRPPTEAPRAAYEPTRPVPERPAWVFAGLIAAGAVLVGTGLTWWDVAARQSATTTLAPQAGIATVEPLAVGGTDVTVVGADRDTVGVTTTLSWSGLGTEPPPQPHRSEGSRLVLGNPCADRGWCNARITVEAPRSVTVRVTGSSGDLSARDVSAVTVVTSSGDIDVDRTAAVDATTSTGDIRVCRAADSLRARTTSGDVEGCELAAGKADVTTTSGDVRLQLVDRVDAVTVSTSSGDAGVRLPSGRPYDVRTSTRSGRVQVGAADDAAAPSLVAVTTTSGDITITN